MDNFWNIKKSLVVPFFGKSGDESHLAHYLSLALQHVGRGIGRAELAGIGQCGGNESTLGASEILCLTVEMVFRNCIGTVDSVAHLYGIELDLHYALLAPHYFYKTGEICLKTLAHPCASRPKENIFGCLLTDGACSELRLVLLSTVALCRLLYRLEIKSVVLHETLVLARHNCNG